MLQNGAVKVFAVDVGRGQLDWKLRQDARVVSMEKTNIRYVKPEDIGEPVGFCFSRRFIYFTGSCASGSQRTSDRGRPHGLSD